MPYRKSPFFVGGYYHIFNRGTEKRDIFLNRTDNERFLRNLEKYLEERNVSLFAFCLMPNHFHLLARQDNENGLSEFMRKLGTAYSMYFNKRYKRVGPLFQGRFKAKLIEYDSYLLQVSRYIHLNPLELILARLKDGSLEKTRPLILSYLTGYSWSSLPEYLKRKDYQHCNLEILDYFLETYSRSRYEDFLLEGVEDFVNGKLSEEEF